jgi:hypothetical protein
MQPIAGNGMSKESEQGKVTFFKGRVTGRNNGSEARIKIFCGMSVQPRRFL